MRTIIARACLVVLGLFLQRDLAAQGYQKPPKVISDILNAPPAPQVSLSPNRDYLLLLQGERYPSIADLAEPYLRLAGEPHRSAPSGPQLAPRITQITVQKIADGKQTVLKLPANARPGTPNWSPDGKTFAFLNTTGKGIELWLGDPATGDLRRIEGVTINDAYGEALQWLPDSKSLLCQSVGKRGAPPQAPQTPPGPTIQESSGKAAPVRTYQDLLKNPHDEDLFDHYATSQLVLIDTGSGKQTPLGKPAVIRSSEVSPDGNYILVVRNERPYSYVQPATAFPRVIEVWSSKGELVKTLAKLPLADRVPIEGVPTGPRSHQWRPTEPATLIWVEALDGGDPKKKVPHRDHLLSLKAPFKDEPSEWAKTEHRFMGLTWGEKNLALIGDYDRERKHRRTFRINPDDASEKPQLIWDRSIQDRYGDPGTPLTKRLPNGRTVLRQNGDDIFLNGNGASSKGDRPFLDRMNLKTLKTSRLFQSGEDCYENIVAVLSDAGNEFILRHESPTSPPNYYLASAEKKDRKALTEFKDPAPELRKIKKQLVTYKRADGVQLSFTLYLPPDYQQGQRLPTVVWAYPREFNDPSTAGQVVGSPNRFTSITGTSHLFFLLQGYAVLDGATMPVVGDPETANNTFLEQIAASAKAAIDKAVEMGVTDRDRVGVGGHSYGAFMTGNLLAHTDLFRAGIARSGAYNRTLTPFGFQSERRTLWEAPEVYLKVSPLMHAHKINEPILLIHGEADNNAGTFPMQSDRLYQAIRGNGGTVRYVTLPHESHGYAARESVEHTLYEMLAWFDKHVKNAPSRKQ